MNPEQTRFWLVAYEMVYPKKCIAYYGADATDLDVFSAINQEHEDGLEGEALDTHSLLQDGGLWDMAQRSNVFFSQSELDYLTQGILRRVVLMTPDPDRGTAMVHAIPVQEPPPAGESVSERYGIKVWRLPKPVPLKVEDPWTRSGSALLV